MTEQTGSGTDSDPEGIDHTLSAGVSHNQPLAPGSDAAADADPTQDKEQYADAVQTQAEKSGAAESRGPQEPPD